MREKIEAQVTEFKMAYHLMDLDHSGEINVDELFEGVKLLGMPDHHTEVQILFMEIDVDGSGEMDMTEFSRMMSNPTSPRQEALHNRIVEMRESFLLFDADRSGEVDLMELHLWLTRYGNRDTPEQVQAIVEQAGADEDGDGTLDFREFIKVLNGRPTVLSTRINSQLGQLRKLFRFVDPDATGWVNADRLYHLFAEHGKLFTKTILDDFLNVIGQAVKALDAMFQQPQQPQAKSIQIIENEDNKEKSPESETIGFAEFVLSIGVEPPSDELKVALSKEATASKDNEDDNWGGQGRAVQIEMYLSYGPRRQ